MSKENENIENSVGITVTFESLISEYAGTAMAYLGGMQDPETKKVFVDLGIAKRMIDTIELLKEKTEGNLTMPEKNFMENTLYNLRMSFVNSANNSPPSVENSDSEDSPSSDDSQPQPQQS